MLSETTIERPPFLKPVSLFLIATTFGALLTAESCLLELFRGREFGFNSITWSFFNAYLWLLFAPLILWTARRFPLRRSHTLEHVLTHFLIGIIFSAIHLSINTFLTALSSPAPQDNTFEGWGVIAFCIYRLSWRMIVYAGLILTYDCFDYFRREQTATMTNARLQSEVAQTELQSVKTQIDPKLILAVLQRIGQLIVTDVKQAHHAIVLAGDYLRATLHESDYKIVEAHRAALQPFGKVKSAISHSDDCSPIIPPAVDINDNLNEQTVVKAPAQRWTWVAISSVWLIIGLFFSGREALIQLIAGRTLSFLDFGLLNAPWFIWALLTPLLLQLMRKLPLEKPRLVRNGLIHVGISTALWLVTIVAALLLDQLRGTPWMKPNSLFMSVSVRIGYVTHLIIYVCFALVYQTSHFYGRYFRNQTRNATLKEQLTVAKLHLLKMQLHPHFIFNALHSISGLMYEDSHKAVKMIKQLIRFLSLTLQDSSIHMIPLKRELEFIRAYLEIEKMRFEDRLSLRIQIEPSAEDVPVPALVLQPLVENAVQHGISAMARAGEIRLTAHRKNGFLHVEIKDNGPGRNLCTIQTSGGLGLKNTRQRLNQIYGESYKMTSANADTGGYIVCIDLPDLTVSMHSDITLAPFMQQNAQSLILRQQSLS